MNGFLVSVIIPTYNTAEFLTETIKSVLSQTFDDFELIIIDDGSTDNTQEVVSGFNDSRIRYIKTSNRGNYFARNRGLEESTGEYIAFLDADDLWIPEKLEKQIAFLREKKAFFCSCDTACFFGEDRHTLYEHCVYTVMNVAEKSFYESLINGNFVPTSSVVARKECFTRLGFFDTSFQNAMDYEMWLRIVSKFDGIYLNEKLLIRRERDKGISRNRINTFKACFYIYDKMIHNQKKFSLNKTMLRLVFSKRNEMLYYLALENLCKKFYKDAFIFFTKYVFIFSFSRKIRAIFFLFCALFRTSKIIDKIIQKRGEKQAADFRVISDVLNIAPIKKKS